MPNQLIVKERSNHAFITLHLENSLQNTSISRGIYPAEIHEMSNCLMRKDSILAQINNLFCSGYYFFNFMHPSTKGVIKEEDSYDYQHMVKIDLTPEKALEISTFLITAEAVSAKGDRSFSVLTNNCVTFAQEVFEMAGGEDKYYHAMHNHGYELFCETGAHHYFEDITTIIA